MFPLLGVLFLDHLLELVRFLAQLREGLLYGIGFLAAWLLRTFFIAVRRFLVARSNGLFGSFLATLLAVQSFLVTRSVGLIRYFLATYALDCLERQKEQMHVHRSPTFLVKVEQILPCVRARS